MEFFLAVFLMGSILGEGFFFVEMLGFVLVVYLGILLVYKLEKAESLQNSTSYAELEFKKAKWDAVESHGNKRLKRFGAYVGWDGVGVEYEHDNRGDPY